MFIVVAYDISTENKDGQIRLRKVSQICNDYGVRVQNSVFECVVDIMQFQKLQREIKAVICLECDSVRYYNLGNNGRVRVTTVGCNTVLNVDEPLII